MKREANRDAERRVLGSLMKNTSKVFDVDQIWLSPDDFYYRSSRCAYQAIVDLAPSTNRIDPVILETKIAEMFPPYYNRQSDKIHKLVRSLNKQPGSGDIEEYARIVLSSSIKRKAFSTLKDTYREVEDLSDHKQIIARLEQGVFDFTAGQNKDTDIVCLAEELDAFVKSKKKMLKEGKSLGISSGYHFYDEAIGGGHRRGAVDIIVARAKTGKSIYALNEAYHVSQNTPVLYLDTELSKKMQMARLLSIMTGVPIRKMENGKFLKIKKYNRKVKSVRKKFRGLKLDYVSIKGWDLARQISLIRNWFARRVGRDKDGVANDALVILDYIKIMDFGSIGKNMSEWMALGLQLSALHDLMGQLDISMLAMAQANRTGLEEEHEGAVAGSDRLSWFCDSLSFLSSRRYEDIIADYENVDREEDSHPPNMRMKVQIGRHGGSVGDEAIALYSDIKNPRIPNDKKCGKIEECGVDRYRPSRRRRRETA